MGNDAMTAIETQTELAGRRDYRIEEVAARTGFTKRTLRYYEEIGLVMPAGRSEGNYRLYSEEDVAGLRRIKRLKDVLGIPLADIKRMAEVEATLEGLRGELKGSLNPGERQAHLRQARDELARQLGSVDERLATLEQIRADYAERLTRVDEALELGQ